MRQAVTCPECGRPITSAGNDTPPDCPFCIVDQALKEGDSRPGATSGKTESVRIPAEVAQASPSARMGKYVRVAKLGSGGMGDVWKAWDTELERWVALKLLRHEDPRELERFTREARTAAALSHPNIAAVFEAGEVGGRHYIAMQLVVGRTLDRWPRKDRRGLVSLMRDASRAVGFAHKHGIVHRDLKPANLMVSEGESSPHVVVLDFGLARRVEGRANLSGTATLAGTPAYMSPEQTRGRRADARSDVYSLGATLYELLTRRPPFESDDLYDLLRKITDSEPKAPRALDRSLDRDLETIVLKCLEKDPQRRYVTAEALARDLDRWLAGEPVQARPASPLYRTYRELAKRKALVAAGLSASVILLLVGWWFSVGYPRAEHLRLMAEGTNLWAEARGLAMLGVDPPGARIKAKRARDIFDQAIRTGDEAPAHWMRGRCLQLEGLNDDAMKALERAQELNPNHAESRIDLAKMLLSQYQESRSPTPTTVIHASGTSLEDTNVLPESEEQRRLRERAARLMSGAEAPLAQRNLLSGLLSMGRGNHPEAAKALADYTREERWDAQALFLQGICLSFTRELPAAIVALNQAAAAGGNARVYQWRGLVNLQLERNDDAIKDFTQAIEKNPNLVPAWEGRAVARGVKGLHHEAIQDLERAIEMAPNFARLYSNRGAEYKGLGRLDEAIDDYSRAIEKASSPHWADYYSRGRARFEKKQWREAIDDVTQALTLHPGYARAYNVLGRAKYEMGLHTEAEADWTKAVEIDSKLVEAWQGLGMSKANRGDFSGAIPQFTKAIELNPRDATSWHARGASHYMLEQYGKAIEDCTRALEIDDKLRDAYVHRGESKRFKGDYKEAILDYTAALKLNPNDAAALHWRAHAHYGLGDRKSAAADCRKALEVAPAGWQWRAEVEKELKEYANERSPEK